MTITATTMTAVGAHRSSRWAIVSESAGNGGLARPAQLSGMPKTRPRNSQKPYPHFSVVLIPANRAAKPRPARAEDPLCRATRQTLRLVGHAVQELDETGEIDLLVVVHGQVAAVRAVQVPAPRQRGGHRLHMRRVHRVVPGADDERWHLDRGEIGEPVPALQLGAGAHAQLAGPLHGHVDLRVDMREPALHRV